MDRPVAESNCAEVHDDLAEFALGVLEEHRRAVVAAHAERCAACAAEVTALTRSLDALLDSAPVADPPPGFAERTVAAAMTSRTDPAGERPTVVVPIAPRARRWWIATVAALVLALGAGIGLGSLLSSAAPRPASGVLTAALHSLDGATGTALITPGGTGWLVMSVDGAPGPTLRCVITLTDGTRRDLGTFALTDGWASWAAPLPVPASSVTGAEVVDRAGATVAAASFRS
jgi:hypothetical protein